MTVAFALSGGGNLGALQAGALAALVESGIEPDLFVGTSVGALNAAFLSTRPGLAGAKELVGAWTRLRRPDVVRLTPWATLLGLVGVGDHLLAADRLRALVRRWVQVERIEQARTRLAVTATDALSGDAVVLTSGSVVDALAASAAIPGLFPPVRMDGRWLIDGSLAANRPVLQALDLGATEVYVLTTATAERKHPPRGAVAMAMNSVSLVTTRVARAELARGVARAAAIGGRVFAVPSPEPEAPGPFDYGRGAALADAGYRRTAEWLDAGPRPLLVAATGRPEDEPDYDGTAGPAHRDDEQAIGVSGPRSGAIAAP